MQELPLTVEVKVDTVDGSEIRRENQLRLVVYPIVWGFHTSLVVQDFFHQQ